MKGSTSPCLSQCIVIKYRQEAPFSPNLQMPGCGRGSGDWERVGADLTLEEEKFEGHAKIILAGRQAESKE